MEPKVGVGVLIVKNNKILLGKRKNAHGDGSWCPPGGHLEFNEELADCAARETLEEVGINIKNIKFNTVTNDRFSEKHYLTVHMLAEYDSGEVKVMEEDKCEEWRWFSWNELPVPLFLPLQNLIKQNFDPFNHNIPLQ